MKTAVGSSLILTAILNEYIRVFHRRISADRKNKRPCVKVSATEHFDQLKLQNNFGGVNSKTAETSAHAHGWPRNLYK